MPLPLFPREKVRYKSRGESVPFVPILQPREIRFGERNIARGPRARIIFSQATGTRVIGPLCAGRRLKGTEQPMTDKSSFEAGKFDSISPSFGRRVAAERSQVLSSNSHPLCWLGRTSGFATGRENPLPGCFQHPRWGRCIIPSNKTDGE